MSAPLTEITSTNHTGIIIITNALGLILVLIFLVIRISVRVYLSPPFDIDDWLLFAATVRLPYGQRDLLMKMDSDSILGFLYHLLFTDI